MLSNLFLAVLTFVGTVIFLFTPGPYWFVGLFIVLLSWLVYLILSVPHKPAETRGWLTLGAFFIIFATLLAGGILSFLEASNTPVNLTGAALDSMPYVDARLLAFVVGTIFSLIITLVFFLVVVYVSTVYVLGIPQDEELTFWNAYRLTLFLILDIQLPWLLIQDGEITRLKERGFFKTGHSRGKVIIKPGNAAVFDRGGKITRIEGPGVVVAEPQEYVRQHFDLRPHFEVLTLDNVITADRIPLKIEYGIGYRLQPTGDNPTTRVISDNLNAYSVEEVTLRRATFNTTAGGWRGIAGAVGNNIRDRIMSLNLEDLLDPVLDPANRPIAIIEQQAMTAVNGFAGDFGVVITAVDIRQISLPGDVKEALYMRIKAEAEAAAIERSSRAEAEAIRRIEQERNTARGTLLRIILENIALHTGQPIGDVELQLATVFAEISKRALTDDVLGHQYVEMLKKLAEGEGTKIIGSYPGSFVGRDDLLTPR